MLGPIELQGPQVPGLTAADGDVDEVVPVAPHGPPTHLSTGLLGTIHTKHQPQVRGAHHDGHDKGRQEAKLIGNSQGSNYQISTSGRHAS